MGCRHIGAAPTPPGGRLPQSLADLLLARVGQLPEETQRVLGAAAVADAGGALACAEQLVVLDRMLEPDPQEFHHAGVVVTRQRTGK